MNDVSLPDSATNVLVLLPDEETAIDVCSRTPGNESARYLVVSFGRPAEDYVQWLRTGVETNGSEIAVIEARDDVASEPSDGVIVRRESPTNLTAIGVQSNEFVTRWRDQEEPIVVFFDSITGLLQYADLDLAYRFLHVFTGRLHHADAKGIYHMSPEAHDETTVGTIRQLFDVIVERDPDTGEVMVNEW